MNHSRQRKLIGMLLKEAALVSSSQIEVALTDQRFYEDLRLGEILALRGWVKQATADFFAERWCTEIDLSPRNPLGYYLKSAALIDEDQIQDILKEQPKLGIRFGAIAVLKGWIRQETVDFFLEHLAPDQKAVSAFYDKRHRLTASPTYKESSHRNHADDVIDFKQEKIQTLNSKLSKYATSSFFSENNLYISDAQIILPSGEDESYDLVNALDYDLNNLDKNC